MNCSVNRSTVFTLNLSEDDYKALRTVLGILNDICTQMLDYHIDSLSSDGGSYSFDLHSLGEIGDTLEGIKSCDRWIGEE